MAKIQKKKNIQICSLTWFFVGFVGLLALVFGWEIGTEVKTNYETSKSFCLLFIVAFFRNFFFSCFFFLAPSALLHPDRRYFWLLSCVSLWLAMILSNKFHNSIIFLKTR